MEKDIYSYIEEQEKSFLTDEVQIGDNWFWNFRKHVQLIFHLKNGIFFTGANDFMRAFKAIMEPILELCYWTEDIDVKDVVFYDEESEDRALSFLVKKYHDEVYVREHDLDTLFDQITETDIDYGGVIVQKGVERPEVVEFTKIAFCDQTDIMGGPLFFKHYFTPDALRGMSKIGWGKESSGATSTIEDLCFLATEDKEASGTIGGNKNKTPGRTIEVYIGRGNMPETWAKQDGDDEKYVNQVQVVAFYRNKKEQRVGVTLYAKPEAEGNLKFFSFSNIPNRALGRGIGERLIHPQIWTNWDTIHKNNLLEAGAKVPLITDDPEFGNQNKIQDMENLELTTIGEGKTVRRIDTASPVNVQLFDRSISDWYNQAQLAGAAFDPIMGQQPNSGTTFRGQNQIITQGRGPHDRRKGKRAKFIEEIYRDWILPDIIKELTNGKKFLAELSSSELEWVAEQMATCWANDKIKEMIFNGATPSPDEQKVMMDAFSKDYKKKGNKKLLEILKSELADKSLGIGIDVAGKQKNLAALSDQFLSIIENAMANPQGFQFAMQNPSLKKAFDNVIEYGGLSPVDFSNYQSASANMAQSIPAPQPSPIQPQVNANAQ